MSLPLPEAPRRQRRIHGSLRKNPNRFPSRGSLPKLLLQADKGRARGGRESGVAARCQMIGRAPARMLGNLPRKPIARPGSHYTETASCYLGLLPYAASSGGAEATARLVTVISRPACSVWLMTVGV